ncbi:MAG TPA: DUF2948 family protein [Stellaceae bacterium]|jgi:hypothetical protein|nr:DUF2948 family protein [Stellaceae bacterium]
MLPEETKGALRLRAEDADDLAVISACLQDALVPVGDIVYMPQEQSFLFVANRFRWEDGPQMEGEPGHVRTLCAVAFDAVEAVLYRGFRREERERILVLLAMRPEPLRAEGGGAVRLDFSGGATIRLETGRIRCRVRDVGLPWPTSWRPAHDQGDPR